MTDRLTTEIWSLLLSQVDWTHSFVREFYFVSHRYFDKDKQDLGLTENFRGSPYATFRIVWAVVAWNKKAEMYGLELNLVDAKNVWFQSTDDSPPQIVYDQTDRTPWSVRVRTPWSVRVPSIGLVCNAREILYTVLGNEYLGPHVRLGHEAPNDEYIVAKAIDGHWRQCSNCANVWEEFDSVAYARCPSCDELTLREKS
jgi:hypothetical protein